MATWAAQLQSIQRLGSRLSGLTEVREIGHAIATELRQLIDYHNVRVYRTQGDDLIPVAMLGHGAVYSDETVENLRVEVGEGVTGWVAKYRVPQLVDDTANDPRAITIPGSEPDIDESMLLAPMVHEGICLGVLVLSKLGLRQFTEDDLRLLVIYASFAAQAMANADATARLKEQSAALERQLAAQRELLRTTESILTTLDQRAVLEQITDRLGDLIHCDNIAIEVVDRAAGILVPADRPRRPRRRLHGAVGAGRDRDRDLGRRAQRAGPDRRREDRRPRQPLPRHGRHRRQPDRRPAARPRRAPPACSRSSGSATPPASTSRSSSSSSCSPPRSRSPSATPRSFQAAEVRARTDDLTGLLNHRTFKRLARPERVGGRAVRPRDGRPRRVQDRSTTPSATRPATGCCARSPAPSRRAPATPTPCSATAATSS